MTIAAVEVVRPGALTTVQDLGRVGWQQIGVSAGGAMDRFAATVANLLAGNSATSALLEVTVMGPHLKFHHDSYIALAGADLAAKLNNAPLAPWSSTAVHAGEALAFGNRIDGVRAYLAMRGGFDVPLVFQSYATDLRGKFGGHEGRPLRAGDILYSHPVTKAAPKASRFLLTEDVARFHGANRELRVLRSGEKGVLDNDSWQTFLSDEYVVLPDSDRMGIRLDGLAIQQRPGAIDERWSEPVCVGTIQVPPSGQPIVLMADRQTVGGYPTIGTVISVDIGRLAQVSPGEAIRFSEVGLEEAQGYLKAQRQFELMLKAATL